MTGSNEHTIFHSLRRRFPPGAYALLPQVRNGTGTARKTARTADAIVVSCWPSRGLWIGGIEIKVTKSDFRKEIAEPEKAESISRFCKHWWIASPPGVVPKSELPENWGLIECTATMAKDVVAAATLDCVPPDMLFVASVLRAATNSMIPLSEVQERYLEVRQQAEESAKKMQKRHVDELELKISTFESSSGVCLSRSWESGDIGRAVAFVRDCGLPQAVYAARQLIEVSKETAKAFETALEKLTSEVEHANQEESCGQRK